MRYESLICDLIYTNENWKQILEQKNIVIKIEEPYAIFNYDIGCDFSDPYVCEARGIIIDLRDIHVVCRAFNKFFNVQEPLAAKIDWDSAIVQEKLDGSLIKIWWNGHDWVISTNGCVYASQTKCFEDLSFEDVVKNACNYRQIIATLDKMKEKHFFTWVFELVSPYNQIVVNYRETCLYYLTTFSNSTGAEYNIPVTTLIPKQYPLKTISDCLNAVEMINKGLGKVNHEGFVVKDKDNHRIKIKTPEYLMFHRISANHNLNKQHLIEIILANKGKSFANQFPIYEVYVKYYDFAITYFKFKLSNFLAYCRNLDEEYSHNRKAIALMIKDNAMAGFGFKMLFKGQTEDEIISGLTLKDYCKYIKEFSQYEREIA